MFNVLEEIIGKIIESRYIGIFPIIVIGRRLPQNIGGLRELSAKLVMSKMPGKLSKNYRYRKKKIFCPPLAGGQFGNVPSKLTLGRRNLMQVSMARNVWRSQRIILSILHIFLLFAKQLSILGETCIVIFPSNCDNFTVKKFFLCYFYVAKRPPEL